MTGPVRVLTVPSAHPYVEHVRDPLDADGPTWVPGPVGDPAAGPWQPPVALTPGWASAHGGEVDVVHLHFGFDASAPEELAAWVEALHARGTRLVYTVHDLRNPHHGDPAAHDAQLDVLVRGSDAVLTLTDGAAAEIARRWGREALVLPHPHVVPDELLGRARPAHDGFVVGVHLKSLRANTCGLDVLEPLAAVVAALPGARLVVDVHTEATRPGFVRADDALLAFVRAAADRGELELRVHDRFTDDELWDYLQRLDLSVLPYAFGTHSGWVEACYDLGTAVLAPRTGHWHEQQAVLGYDLVGGQVDASSLADAVRRALAGGPAPRADAARRRRQRRDVAAAHTALYRRLAGASA